MNKFNKQKEMQSSKENLYEPEYKLSHVSVSGSLRYFLICKVFFRNSLCQKNPNVKQENLLTFCPNNSSSHHKSRNSKTSASKTENLQAQPTSHSSALAAASENKNRGSKGNILVFDYILYKFLPNG